MVLRVVITDNEADFQVLSGANEQGKFAVPIDATGSEDTWKAFERGLDNDWYRLIDVARLTATNGQVARVFRLTATGFARLKEVTEARK